MPKQLQHRRGTTAEHAVLIGAIGEFTYNTETKRIHAHDGSTAGGIPLAKVSELPAGSPLVAGSFGLGGAAPAVSAANALNNIGESGFVRVVGSAISTVGGPTGLTAASVVQTIVYDTNNAIQMLFPLSGSTNPQVYRRRKAGGTWSIWIADIERGSNANGSFVKLADGTLICRKIVTGLGPVSTAANGWFMSDEIDLGSWAFPFVGDQPDRSFDVRRSSTVSATVFPFSPGNTSLVGSVKIQRTASLATTDFSIYVRGEGRWY